MVEKQYPLVSVVMSVYNDELYVAEAINSIISQSYENLEIIIINDASVDNSERIIKSFKDPRIRYYANDRNRKLAYSLNYAISVAQGKYIARMDADDISCITRIEKQVLFLESHNEVDIVGSYAKTFGDYETVLQYPINHDEIKATLLFHNALCHPAVMIRRSSLDQLYDENLAASQDYELWARLIWTKTFHNIPEVLLNYRVHPNQTKNKNGVKQKAGAIAARRLILMRLFPEFDHKLLLSFDEMFLVGKSRSADELHGIEQVLNQIKLLNNTNNVLKAEVLNELCSEIFYQNWYYSLGHDNINIDFIKDTAFSNYYYSMPIKRKIKIHIQYYRKRVGCVLKQK